MSTHINHTEEQPMTRKTTRTRKTTLSSVHDKVVSEARRTYYTAIEAEFVRLILEGCAAKDFDRVEQEFLQYGQYLTSHPDALRVTT